MNLLNHINIPLYCKKVLCNNIVNFYPLLHTQDNAINDLQKDASISMIPQGITYLRAPDKRGKEKNMMVPCISALDKCRKEINLMTPMRVQGVTYLPGATHKHRKEVNTQSMYIYYQDLPSFT